MVFFAVAYRAFSLTWPASMQIYCITKEFNSQSTCLGRQHGRGFIVLGHQYGRRDVMRQHSIWPPWRHVKKSIEFVYIFSLPWWNSVTVQQKGKLYRRAWGRRFLCVWHRLQWNSLRKLPTKRRFMPRYIKEIFIISVAEVMNVRHVSLIRVG